RSASPRAGRTRQGRRNARRALPAGADCVKTSTACPRSVRARPRPPTACVEVESAKWRVASAMRISAPSRAWTLPGALGLQVGEVVEELERFAGPLVEENLAVRFGGLQPSVVVLV